MLVLKENENEDMTNEDVVLIQSYLSNWKNLQDKIKYFIPEEFYDKKNNYYMYACLYDCNGILCIISKNY